MLFMLVLLLAATTAVQGPQVTLPAAAAGFTAHLGCGKLGAIVVTSAVFAPSNPTAECVPTIPGSTKEVGLKVAAACNGKSSCGFPVCPFKGFPGGGPNNDGAACANPIIPPIGDPCPNYPKSFVVEYSCATTAGWGLVTLILVVGGLYVGLGVLYGSKTAAQQSVSLRSHPHHQQWLEVHALTKDGIAHVFARLQGRVAPSYQPMSGNGMVSGANADSFKNGRKTHKIAKSKKTQSKARHSASGQTAPNENVAGLVAHEGGETQTQSQIKGTTAGGGGRWVHIS